MGTHYIPQEYLRHFANPVDPDKIWMYDKSSGEIKLLPIKVVAQESSFYTPEDERALNETIEGPAQFAIDELRLGKEIDDKSRTAVSKYIVQMIFRVPAMRIRLNKDAHQLLPSMVRVAKQHAESVARARGIISIRSDYAANSMASPPPVRHSGEGRNPESPISENTAALHEIGISSEEVFDQSGKWENQHKEGPPSLKDDAVRKQFAPQLLVDTVNSMTWRVISAPRSESFLTGDNPVFTLKETRLGRPHGEFSIPLSSRVALHGSWNGEGKGLYPVDGSTSLVREINRRSVANAERFVFYYQSASWVRKLVKSPIPKLQRIRWTAKSDYELLPSPPFNPLVWTDESLLEDLKSPPVDLVNFLTGSPS